MPGGVAGVQPIKAAPYADPWRNNPQPGWMLECAPIPCVVRIQAHDL